MSTIPLSVREGHGRTLSGGDAPIAMAHAADDKTLDALIDSVTETIASRGSLGRAYDELLLDVPADDDENDSDATDSWRAFKAKLDDPDTSGASSANTALDRALKAAVDRRAGHEVESADFHQSREWRDALKERYGARVAIGDLLDTFADWHTLFKANPQAAGNAMVAAYLAQPSYALPSAGKASRKPDTPDSMKNERTPNKLDGVLAAAIHRHHGKGDGEPQVFAASARQRAALKEMFPGMSYAEACRRVVMLDGDLHRDPVGTAARLAATYGMTETGLQPAAPEQQRSPDLAGTQQMIATTMADLPGLADMEDELVDVMSRSGFRHGPDLQQNLLRAYRIVQLARQQRGR